MKIIVIGAAGDIGQAACNALGAHHDLIRVGRTSGDLQVDISDAKAVADMYARVGPVEAVVSTAGDAHFAPLQEQSSETLALGLTQKVMGQINLVINGLNHVTQGGSFTLTSGILDRDPIVGGVGAATANGAIAGFVAGASIEMPRSLRLNAVSPGLLEASAPRYGHLFAGHVPVSGDRVGQAYVKCVEGALSGRVVCVD